MSDQYTRTDTAAPVAVTPAGAPAGTVEPTRRPVLRIALWLLLLAAAVGNVITSTAGLLTVSVPLGLVVLGLVAALVVEHRRTRP